MSKFCPPAPGCKPVEGKCVKYSGSYLVKLNVATGEDMDSILLKINNLINTSLLSPNLQQVSDVGNTTSNSIISTSDGNYSTLAGIQMSFNSGGYGVIDSNSILGPTRLDINSSVTNFISSIVGVTEIPSENSDKMASTAWVKLQGYLSTEVDPIAQAKSISITSGSGITITGTTQTIGSNPQFIVSANNTSAIWNANSLQGIGISTTAPSSGQVLIYNGSQWAPGTGGGSGGVTSVAVTSSDITVTGSPITSSGTITLTLPNLLSAGTYNSLTVNNKGLVTSATNQSYITTETDPTVPTIVKNITQVDIDNWNSAFDKFTTGVGVTGTTTKTITITLNDSSTVLGAFTDENNFPTSLTFNSTNGILTLGRSGLSALTANLTDSRYALKATTILPSGNGLTGGGDLSANRIFSLDFSYLDDRYLSGYKQRAATRVATTANITLSGSQTIDGITLTNGDRVLVKNQTAGAENGIYIYNSGGAWTRATDFDQATSDEISQGSQIFIQEGTVNGKTGWSLSTPEPYTIGTTSLTFIQYAGANTYTAGTGLNLIGNQFSAQTTTALWNAAQLRGVTISSTTPTSDQILLYDGSSWVPFTSSIGVSMPSIFSVSGSPITDLSGTIGVTLNTQSINVVFAGPSSGGAAIPTFRALVSNDIPSLDASKITSGIFPIARGGTGLSSLGTTNQLIRVNSGATALEYFTPTYISSNQTITLSGDVTGSGATSITTTISNNAVTYAKIQDVTSQKLLGRYAATTGDAQEITIGSGLSLDSSTGILSATTGGSGTVTSVGLSLPSIFTVSGSPVTTSGTLTATLATQTTNLFFASPNGSTGVPTFRAIVNNDFPNSGVAAGSYNTVTVNTKGIVTSASNTSYTPTTRTLTLIAGTGITVSPTGAQDLSTNRTWTITNTGAPASGSNNYIQNQSFVAQVANAWISGTYRASDGFRLSKDGSNSISGGISLYNSALTLGANLQLDASTTPGLNFWIHDGTTWQNRMTLGAAGNIGIGIATPNEKLDVGGGVNITTSSSYKIAGTDVIYTPTDLPTNGVYINARVIGNNSSSVPVQDGMFLNYASTGGAGAHLRLFANGTTERVRIDANSGNMGIGTTTPGAKLEVNGQVKITGGAPGVGKLLTSDATGLATWSLPNSELLAVLDNIDILTANTYTLIPAVAGKRIIVTYGVYEQRSSTGSGSQSYNVTYGTNSSNYDNIGNVGGSATFNSLAAVGSYTSFLAPQVTQSISSTPVILKITPGSAVLTSARIRVFVRYALLDI
jgi:hypothetical protein